MATHQGPEIPVEILEWWRSDRGVRDLWNEKNNWRHPGTNEHIIDAYHRVHNPQETVKPTVEIKRDEKGEDIIPSPEDLNLSVEPIKNDAEFGVAGRVLMPWDDLSWVPKVTFITASRNRPNYVLNAYMSCFNQTFINWEWIIMDDSDVPGMNDVLRMLSADRRVKIFKSKGRKISPLWNYALSKARGKYIAIHDDDNWNHKDFLKYTINEMEKDSGLIGTMTWFEFKDDHGTTMATGDRVKINLNVADVKDFNCGDGNNILWRRTDLLALGGFDDTLWTNEDFDVVRKGIRVGKMSVIPKVLHYYRNHSQNRSHIKDALGHDRDYNFILNMDYKPMVNNYVQNVDLKDLDISGLIGRLFYLEDFRPQQLESEIKELLEFLNVVKPEKILEIGMAKGGTSILFSEGVKNPHETRGIDLLMETDRAILLGKRGIKVQLGDSKRSWEDWPYGLIDFLFIDGDHTVDGVRADFNNFYDLVAPDGIIAFHDINPNADEPSSQVHEYWNFIKSDYRHMEINHAPPNKGYGIGIIWKGENEKNPSDRAVK